MNKKQKNVPSNHRWDYLRKTKLTPAELALLWDAPALHLVEDPLPRYLKALQTQLGVEDPVFHDIPVCFSGGICNSPVFSKSITQMDSIDLSALKLDLPPNRQDNQFTPIWGVRDHFTFILTSKLVTWTD